MKKLLILLAIIFCTVSAYADEDQEEVKYQVSIEVTYNAVSIEEASEIIADAMERHKSACKTKVESKKVGDDEYVTYTSVDGFWVAK